MGSVTAELLDEAWLNLIRNSAHDSICACSVDEVCDAVLHRYAEATRRLQAEITAQPTPADVVGVLEGVAR